MKLSDKVKSIALGASVLSLTLPASALAAGPVMEEEAIIRVAEEEVEEVEEVEDIPAPIRAEDEDVEEAEVETTDADEEDEIEEIENADELLDIDEDEDEDETIKEAPEKETPEKETEKKPVKEEGEDKNIFKKFIDSPISLVILGVALVAVLALSKRK